MISFKIGVFKNFALITGKHLCWSLFLIKLQACRQTQETQVFSCIYCEFFMLSRISVLINYIKFFRVQVFMIQVFHCPGFLGSRFFRVRIQGLGPCFRSSPTSVEHFLTLKKKNVKIKAKFMKFIKYITIL